MHVAHVWTALLAAGLAGAALAATPDAKPGLWERTVTRQMEGAPVSPVADVTKLPPEQRARIEQMLATRGVTAPSVSVVRYCVASASAPSWASIAREERDDAGCARAVEADSSAGYRATLACAGGATATLDFTAVAADRIRGTITSSSRGDGGLRTARVEIDSRWVGPDCGTVAPGQPARVKG